MTLLSTIKKRSTNHQTVGVAVITHKAKAHLKFCLTPLLNSSIKPRVLVVNSSSCDGTVDEATRLGAETLVIPRNKFNHGSTRELARKELNCDIVVMMTPDAYLKEPEMLELLVAPIVSKKAAIAYARQVPFETSHIMEKLLREFNYPKVSHIRSLGDSYFKEFNYFSSNACAAYDNDELEKIGGFPTVYFGEDTYVCAQILQKGLNVAYVAEAIVNHSHGYTLKDEFCRNFDIGLGREQVKKIIMPSKDWGRGFKYIIFSLKHLAKKNTFSIPFALCHFFVRFLGYFLGRMSKNAPVLFKKKISNQDFYWT